MLGLLGLSRAVDSSLDTDSVCESVLALNLFVSKEEELASAGQLGTLCWLGGKRLHFQFLS